MNGSEGMLRSRLDEQADLIMALKTANESLTVGSFIFPSLFFSFFSFS